MGWIPVYCNPVEERCCRLQVLVVVPPFTLDTWRPRPRIKSTGRWCCLSWWAILGC